MFRPSNRSCPHSPHYVSCSHQSQQFCLPATRSSFVIPRWVVASVRQSQELAGLIPALLPAHLHPAASAPLPLPPFPCLQEFCPGRTGRGKAALGLCIPMSKLRVVSPQLFMLLRRRWANGKGSYLAVIPQPGLKFIKTMALS